MTAAADVLFAFDKNNVNPGALGFVVVALLGVATWLLIRSMQKQLGKIDFEERVDAAEVGPEPEPDGGERQP
jgi:hypothetical protein